MLYLSVTIDKTGRVRRSCAGYVFNGRLAVVQITFGVSHSYEGSLSSGDRLDGPGQEGE